jgi:hypothetical protein
MAQKLSKLVKDLHRNIHTKFHSNPFSGSQEEDEVNKEVKENNNNKNQIQSWPFIYKPRDNRQQSKGKNTQNYEPNEFDRMRVKQFLSETEVFFVCSAIVFKAFQRGPTKYFLQKKILFHVDLIKMLSLISLFLRSLSKY